MKRKHKLKVALIFALLLVVLAGAAVAATGQRLLTIDWSGQARFEPEETPEATVPPAILAEQDAVIDYVYNLLQEKPDFDYWIAYTDEHSWQHGETIERLASLQEGADRIRASGLRIPDAAPDGYKMVTLELHFYFTEEDLRATTLTSAQNMAHGVLLKRYHPPEKIRAQIKGYWLVFEDRSGTQLTISADRGCSSVPGGFGLEDVMTYEPVTVQGMSNALYLTRTDLEERSLFLLQKDTPLRTYALFMNFDDPAPEWQQYDTTDYRLSATGLTKAQLIALADSLR